MSSCRPETLVEVLVMGEGMAATRWRSRYRSRERSLAVASSRRGHSRVTDVWVMLRSWWIVIWRVNTSEEGWETDLEIGVLGSLRSKGVENIALEVPKVVLSLLLLCVVPLHRNVDDGAGGDARREKQRRELDEMGTLPKEDLEEG